ncbi:hypothetical protein GE061_002909 [Apolygus lucorum]|uniref:Uncharacterized protein n=1 Tax=Apolygus lucorum TaxID=248454 RepID=A0A6A4J5T8_APOLU|nr:hypothetical protein GE061_002909 [Apolygus lucorum]
MDKQQEAQADSISTVGVQIKPDYPPSEVYSSEPPPAYQRPRHTAVQIARIAAVTLVAVSFILGFFMVASAYITANATCYQDYPAPQEQGEERPMFQALQGNLVDPLDTEESSHSKRESADSPSRSHQQHETSQSDDSAEDQPIRVKLPLQLDFDELAGSMIEKNQRSRMNCVVEKRRAEEVMDHQPKTVNLPFGVNLTTDPRYEHITGERMAIFCESGNDQRHVPMEQEQNVPMMQMHVVPIQVQQIPLHPNAIPHGPHPMHFHHQQMPRPVPHMVAPNMNGPQMGAHMGPHVLPHMVQQQVQQPHQVHPQIQAQGPVELPPQVLQAVQEQLVAEQQMAAQQMAAQQQQQHHNRRFPPQAQINQIMPDSAEQVFIQEEIIPILHPQAHPRPEGRSMEGHPVLQAIDAVEQHPVPSETFKPPPPPGFRQLPASDRPHYVQPRSIRDVSSVLTREKRVRRCACDCAC